MLTVANPAFSGEKKQKKNIPLIFLMKNYTSAKEEPPQSIKCVTVNGKPTKLATSHANVNANALADS